MMVFKKSLAALSLMMFFQAYAGLTQEARKKGFVYLKDIDPTIRVSLRYFSSENFVGKPVDSYNSDVLIVHKKQQKN